MSSNGGQYSYDYGQAKHEYASSLTPPQPSHWPLALQVFFCDPLISSGDISGFLVQWDTDEDFTQAVEGGDTGAGCSETGFGSCVVTDAAVAGQCPYSLLITGLTEGEVTTHLRTVVDAVVATLSRRHNLVGGHRTSSDNSRAEQNLRKRSQNKPLCVVYFRWVITGVVLLVVE